MLLKALLGDLFWKFVPHARRLFSMNLAAIVYTISWLLYNPRTLATTTKLFWIDECFSSFEENIYIIMWESFSSSGWKRRPNIRLWYMKWCHIAKLSIKIVHISSGIQINYMKLCSFPKYQWTNNWQFRNFFGSDGGITPSFSSFIPSSWINSIFNEHTHTKITNITQY